MYRWPLLAALLTTRCLAPITVEPNDRPCSTDEDCRELRCVAAFCREQGAALSRVPTRDVLLEGVVAVGESVAYRAVDDGVLPADADDAATYVRGAAGVPLAAHRVGYASATPSGARSITVNFRARQGTGAGSAQVELYEGTALVGQGNVHPLGDPWQDYSDSFQGLKISDVNALETRMVFRNTGNGALYYTQIWLEITP